MPVRPQLRALASTRARRPKKFAAKRGQGFFCAGESSEPSALNLLLTYCTTQPAAPMGSCIHSSPLPITHCIVPPIARDVDARRLDADEAR